MNSFTKIKIWINDLLDKKNLLSKKLVNPRRDWNTLIIIATIFIVSAVGFDIYTYLKIVNGDMYVNVEKADLIIENLKANDLQKVLTVFENKRDNISNLRVKNLPDPSI